MQIAALLKSSTTKRRDSTNMPSRPVFSLVCGDDEFLYGDVEELYGAFTKLLIKGIENLNFPCFEQKDIYCSSLARGGSPSKPLQASGHQFRETGCLI
jgi:hypothetical protein